MGGTWSAETPTLSSAQTRDILTCRDEVKLNEVHDAGEKVKNRRIRYRLARFYLLKEVQVACKGASIVPFGGLDEDPASGVPEWARMWWHAQMAVDLPMPQLTRQPYSDLDQSIL